VSKEEQKTLDVEACPKDIKKMMGNKKHMVNINVFIFLTVFLLSISCSAHSLELFFPKRTLQQRNSCGPAS